MLKMRLNELPKREVVIYNTLRAANFSQYSGDRRIMYMRYRWKQMMTRVMIKAAEQESQEFVAGRKIWR